MVETRIRSKVQEFEPLTIFRFPFYLENLLVLFLFMLMFTIASIWASLPIGLGWRSVPFWFLSITIFFNYAFVIVDYTSRGLQRVPKLSGELVLPSNDARLYSIAGLTILFFSFLFVGEDLSPGKLIAAFFSYPLAFSLLVVHRSPLILLNPMKLAFTLWTFSTSKVSLVFYLLQFATGALLYFNFTTHGDISAAHLFWQVPLSVLMLFTLFRALGVVLNTQGPKFGLLVLQNADTYEAALEEEARIQLDEFLVKLHRWARVHEYKKAWGMIEEFNQEHHHKYDGEMFHRLSQWDDHRLAVMVGAAFAEHLMKTGENERALKVFREAHTLNPDRFKFSSGMAALQFADAAKDIASLGHIAEYLKKFDEDFPDHPSSSVAAQKLNELQSRLADT